jgi:hypothetical protein
MLVNISSQIQRLPSSVRLISLGYRLTFRQFTSTRLINQSDPWWTQKTDNHINGVEQRRLQDEEARRRAEEEERKRREEEERKRKEEEKKRQQDDNCDDDLYFMNPWNHSTTHSQSNQYHSYPNNETHHSYTPTTYPQSTPTTYPQSTPTTYPQSSQPNSSNAMPLTDSNTNSDDSDSDDDDGIDD